MKRGDYDWTDDKIAMLRELWDAGHSAAEIGRRMNCSKNAVVGKAGRVGLSRPSPIRRDGPVKQAAPYVRKGERMNAGPGQLTALRPGTMLDVPWPPRPLVPVKSPGVATKCCFPIGEPKTAGFHFCGERSLAGRPYCGPHCDIAYVSVAKWRRANHVSIASLEAP